MPLHCMLILFGRIRADNRFEGMKAYRQEDDTVRLFRPDKNMARMNKACDARLIDERKLTCRVLPVWHYL